MLTTSDLITLTYTPDLTRAGIAHLCRSLPLMGERIPNLSHADMLRGVAQLAAELAFRRLLTAQGVAYNSAQTTPFADPERYDLILGGRRCQIINTLVTRRDLIRNLRADPEKVIQSCLAIGPQDIRGDPYSEHDMLIFCITNGLITTSSSELERAATADQPLYLIHLLPRDWHQLAPLASSRRTWPLILKSEGSASVCIELGGLAPDATYQCEQISLPRLRRVTTKKEFASLVYVHIDKIPDGRIGIHNPSFKRTHIIQSRKWINLWVYGMDLMLVGYIARREFRLRSQPRPSGVLLPTFSNRQGKNLYLRASELRPLCELFERVKDWISR